MTARKPSAQWVRDARLPKWRSPFGIAFRPCDKRTFRAVTSSGVEIATRFRSADAAMLAAESAYIEERR